ncbi:MAG: hypothetical protein KDK53_12820 [Maritimibacter sp.]|nr:hypothetical protein [Maritimibacter sp.]
MTALKKYQRLEAPGLWRVAPEAQRLNVSVSIGDATLTLSDHRNRPLVHWSLPAVHRLNPGATPALYAPSIDRDEPETLEIDEPEMIEAIEIVRRAIDRSRPRTGRLRLALTVAILAASATLAIFWLPEALVRHTVSVLPDATRTAIGDRLLDRIVRVTGQPCDAHRGQAALDRLADRVLGAENAGRVFVFASGISGAFHLPGRIVLLDRAQVEDYETPEVAAGYILAERQRAVDTDPMLPLLEHAGPFATARLLTTGMLPDGVLDRYGEMIFARPPEALAVAPMLARFKSAAVATTPYAFAIDQSGETTLGLIEADPFPAGEAAPLLSDADWAQLQMICSD